eukprot:768100-Hanusia_phi.AAC.6
MAERECSAEKSAMEREREEAEGAGGAERKEGDSGGGSGGGLWRTREKFDKRRTGWAGKAEEGEGEGDYGAKESQWIAQVGCGGRYVAKIEMQGQWKRMKGS